MWCQCEQTGGARLTRQPPARNNTIRLAGSVGRGGANARNDVLQIQRGLNTVAPSAGRPAPPLKLDGICGPLTTAAIGRFQQVQFMGAMTDHRIDPAGRTLARLNQSIAIPGSAPAANASSSSGFVGASSATGSGGVVGTGGTTTDDQLAQARQLALDAERRIVNAMTRLTRSQAALAKPLRTPADAQLVREVNWHFKADQAPIPAAQLVQVAAIYTFMLTAIRETNTGIRELFRAGTHPEPNAIAFAELGGFFSLIQDDRFIFITPQFRTASSGVIIHELAHFCGGNAQSGRDIVHRASPKPPPRGERREDGSTDYAGMAPVHALTNVFSYTVYCFPEIPEFVPP